jgi:hypothetical protein
LTIKAFKFERTSIGKGRVFREKGHAVAAESFRQPESQAAYQLRAASFEPEPHTRPRPKIQGLNDDLPW